MSQYCSRINILVSHPNVWKRFIITANDELHLSSLCSLSYTNCDFYVDEEALVNIVGEMSVILDKDGVIIADTNNVNVDSYKFCVLYAGGKVRNITFTMRSRKQKALLYGDVRISETAEWLNTCDFKLTNEEKIALYNVGIDHVDEKYSTFEKEIVLPPKIYLRETSFNARSEAIEKIAVGDEVQLTTVKSAYDYMRIEVICKYGSLGYLPSNISDILEPLLVQNKIEHTANIVEVVPASKRNKHVQSSIVAVTINAEYKAKELSATDNITEEKSEVNEKTKTASKKTKKTTQTEENLTDSPKKFDLYRNMSEKDFSEFFAFAQYDSWPKSKTYKITRNGTEFSVSFQLSRAAGKIETQLKYQRGLYDAYSAIETMTPREEIIEKMRAEGSYSDFFVSDEFNLKLIDHLEESEMRRRIEFIMCVSNLINDQKTIEAIFDAATKKKDGTLHKGRILKIASSGIADSFESMYCIVGRNITDTSLTVKFDFINCKTDDNEKWANDFISNYHEGLRISEALKKIK